MKIIWLLGVFIILCGSLFSQSIKAEKIDSLLSECHQNELFNGVALVADSGKIILHKSYGTSNRENELKLKLSDRFYIGSITKQFTSVLILQLQENGFLDIHFSVEKYLREFKDSEIGTVTIYQLLTHTGGLGNYNFNPGFDKAISYSEQEVFNFINEPLLFDPGTEWSYSNSGYYLLGKIASRVTNKTYSTLLNEFIFNPLEMNDSGYDEDWLTVDVAKGYWRTIQGYSPMPKYALNTLFSTGGIYSTALDLFKWDQGLYSNILLNNESKKVLFEPLLNDYACGIYVKKGFDKNDAFFERHFHGGWIKGYHSFILRRLPTKQLVILLDNSYSQEIPVIKNRIWSALIPEFIKPIKPKLSNLLFKACSTKSLELTLDSIRANLLAVDENHSIEEYDINTVGYRLMENGSYHEAKSVFLFNIELFPNSWNVYDSMGELLLKLKSYHESRSNYEKSLELNPESVSAMAALKEIDQLLNEN